MSAEHIGKYVRVELVDIGEGHSGDYNPNNPKDEKLLRFYVQQKAFDYWQDVNNASYCTLIPESTTQEEQNKLVKILYDEVVDKVESGCSIKKLCERLSWISPEWIKMQQPPKNYYGKD